MNTSVLRIDSESGRAEFADGLVLFDIAWPVLRTGVAVAGVATLIVDAGHVSRTATIPQTDGDGCLAVVKADANGLVVQHLARLVGCRTRVSRSGTWTLAAAGKASRIASAIIVNSALDRIRSAGHLALLADDEAVFAYADWPVTAHFASLARVALDILELARILAGSKLGVAGMIGRALRIPAANCRDWGRGGRSG